MRNDSRGFALITTTIILGVLLALAYALISTAVSGRRAAQTLEGSFYAAQAADAGIQKAIFCFNGTDNSKCGGTSGASYAGETNVAIGTGSFTTTISGSGSTRTLTSVGKAANGRTRTVRVEITSIPPTSDPGFSYALQAGSGGARMENNSSIEGTIYANGDVECQSTGAVITGDAYSSKVGGKIDKCTVDFDAHADKVTDSDVGGDAYYLTHPSGISGTDVAGTEYSGQSTPSAADMPDTDLSFWRDSASAGGTISGDYSPADNSTLGPKKIIGDLIMGSNVDVTITGPVWVKGSIFTGNNSGFHLDSSFGSYSTAILADDESNPSTEGKIDITNNTSITGSGTSTSHILFLSTNTSTDDASPAISVANNASGAVFYASNGTLRLQNNAGAKSLAGYRLFLDQNAEVTYLASEFSGLFSNSPAGTWRVSEQTWREAP